MTKKSILILFPDEWLSHSPTVLNMIRGLSESFHVHTIAIDDGLYPNEALPRNHLTFIRIHRFLSRFFLRKLRPLYSRIKALLLLRAASAYLDRRHVDEVIGVDAIGLWVAQKTFGHCHFLSLEVRQDRYFRQARTACIDSILIQSIDRYRFLFKPSSIPVFYVQNAPSISRMEHPQPARPFQKKLIFFGNVMASHGLFSCLEAAEAICQTDRDYTLTIKGVIPKAWVRWAIARRYGKLLETGQIILDTGYTPQEQIVSYLSSFDIGFCLYDFRLIGKNDFNYLSVPSGKLFNFYAAGVPVVGMDIPGLDSIRTFRTGCLIRDLQIDTLRTAVLDIATHFDTYRQNCFRAAEHFDFEKALTPFKVFLQTRNATPKGAS